MKKKTNYIICSNGRKFKNPRISYIFEKYQFFLLVAVNVKIKMKNI